jgi:LacI family transcriptional regulator
MAMTDEDASPNQPRGNLREVAERAGVAMSSVSRVLTDHPDVSPRMRRHVLAVVEEMGYEPNLLAQSLRRGSTLSVGFVIRDISSPLFSEIALGAERELRSHGYAMLLTNSEGLPALDAAHIRLFRQRRVDGLLLSLADEQHEETMDELRRVAVPVVLIDRELSEPLEVSAVLSDHVSGISDAARHLIALGHQRIGLAGGPLNLRPGRELSSALETVCADAGVEAVIDAGPFSEEHGVVAAQRLLDRMDPPTALIAGSNQIFPGVLRVIRQRGISIPRELSVVTFDDIRLLEFVEPPIAVVSREPVVMGREAAAILLRRLKGSAPEEIRIPTTFDPRGSCAPPPRAARVGRLSGIWLP